MGTACVKLREAGSGGGAEAAMGLLLRTAGGSSLARFAELPVRCGVAKVAVNSLSLPDGEWEGHYGASGA